MKWISIWYNDNQSLIDLMKKIKEFENENKLKINIISSVEYIMLWICRVLEEKKKLKRTKQIMNFINFSNNHFENTG